MVVMSSVVILDFLIPKPNMGVLTRKHSLEQNKLKSETSKLFDEIKLNRDFVASQMRTSGPQQVGADVMSQVGGLAEKESVKVTAFRPQRSEPNAGMTRYPYSVVCEGAFPAVSRFVRAIEAPGTKLATVSVQIVAADGETDKVTATIGLVAFLNNSQVKSNEK